MTLLKLEKYTASVVVTSDTCYKDPTQDTSGQHVVEQLKLRNFSRVTKHIVEDDKNTITECIKSITNDSSNVLTITVGGTGLCPRDVTPDATSILYEKHCHGISTALHVASLRYSPHAALSRLTAGVVGQCLIVNFPGKLKACKECFACLDQFLDHAIEQVLFDAEAIRFTHQKQDASSQNQQTALVYSDNKIEVSSSNCTKSESLNKPKIPLSPIIPKLDSSSDHLCLSGLNLNEEPHCASILSTQGNSIASETPEKEIQPNPSYPMIEYTEALNILSTTCQDVYTGEKIISLDCYEAALDALGYILATDLCSSTKIPPFPSSTMDGYVVNVPQSLKNFLQNIGSVPSQLVKNREEFERLQNHQACASSFFCYQINTGGRVPEKNFAVVPVEKTGLRSSKNSILISEIKPDMYVRQPGSDLSETDFIKAGTSIGPVELSLILSMGHKNLKVIKKPTIGILTTGDELVEFYESNCNADKVINTNGPLLTSLFKTRGYPVSSFGNATDKPEDILSKIITGLGRCDILVITGGASMGSKDYVKDVIRDIGGIIHFGRVNIKPGKPAAYATLMKDGKRKFIFALPGNPVSAYVTSIVLVIPFIEHGIRRQFGSDQSSLLNTIGDLINVRIDSIPDSVDGQTYQFDGRLEFLRGKLVSQTKDNLCFASVSIKQQSSRMLNLQDCDLLIMIEPAHKDSKLEVGQMYQALRLR